MEVPNKNGWIRQATTSHSSQRPPYRVHACLSQGWRLHVKTREELVDVRFEILLDIVGSLERAPVGRDAGSAVEAELHHQEQQSEKWVD